MQTPTPDTRLRGRSRFVAAKARNLTPCIKGINIQIWWLLFEI
jgi:hypothetical protein